MLYRLSLVLLGLLLFTHHAFSQSGGLLNRHLPPSVTVAVSPDGSMVALARSSGGAGKRFGRVELWDTRTGELQRTITGFDGPIWSMTFANDGRSLATVSTEYHQNQIQISVKERQSRVVAELKWWDVQTGEFVKKVPLGEEGITSIEATWSPAGNSFAFVERYLKYQVAAIGLPTTPNERGTTVGFDTLEAVNLKLLDAQTAERKVKVEDVDRTFRASMSWLFGRLQQPVFSNNGNTLAAIMGEEVFVWSVASGRKLRAIKKLNGWPTAIAFSPDNKLIAIASINGSMPGGKNEISIWDVATGKSVNRLKGTNDAIACLQFVVSGKALLIGSLRYEPGLAMGTVKLWDLRDNRVKKADIHEGKAVSFMTLIHDRTAVVIQSESEVEVRDARTWDVIHAFAESDDDKAEAIRRSGFLLTAKRATAVAFSADGTTVSAEVPGEGIRVWDVRTGGMKNHIPSVENEDELSLVATNGGLVAEADGETGRIEVLDEKTKKSIRTIEAGQKVTALAIDSSGRFLAAARADRSIVLWDVKTGAVRGELRKHSDVVNALAFSPDGTTLASGGDDRSAILWNVSSGKAKRTLKGHDLTVTSLAFSPDGQTLATGSGNAVVVLWNVASGKLDRILR